MAISLKSLKRVTGDGPPRILIYGQPGMAKTTLASEFPAPVFLQVEDGAPRGVNLDSFGILQTFGEVLDAITALYNEEHEFSTVVVDSITEMQRLVWAETCARGDEKGLTKSRIEDFGYGKGYVNALTVWQEFLEGLNSLRRDRGMAIVLIAHSRTDRYDDPETVSYDRYEIDLHDKAVGMIERDMDAILILKKPVTVKEEDVGFNKKRVHAEGSSDTIYIYTQGKPAYVAKNRYDMPEKLLFKRGAGYAALAPFLPGGAVAAPAAPVKTKKEAA